MDIADAKEDAIDGLDMEVCLEMEVCLDMEECMEEAVDSGDA